MSLSSLRMLLLLFFAAVVLNITNYMFSEVYDPLSNKPVHRYHSKFGRHSKIPRPIFTPEILCENTSTKIIPASIIELKVLNRSVQNASKVIKQLCPEIPTVTALEKLLDIRQVGLNLRVEAGALNNKLLNVLSVIDSNVERGGAFKPLDCIARHNAAIIIPFSGSKSYLNGFLYYLHSVLLKQQLDYQIFVVEPCNPEELFNRGKLINAAFVEAQRLRKNGWQCIIIHEPYLLPMYSSNLYRCSRYPKQLAVNVERTDKASYMPQFGGAVALKPEHILKVNGFPNIYWGSDGDYTDFYKRLISVSYSIERSTRFVGKYMTLDGYEGPTVVNREMAQTDSPYKMSEDGLSSLKYTLEYIEGHSLYTNINVCISESNPTMEVQSTPSLIVSI